MAVYSVSTCVLVLAALSGVSLCVTDSELTQKYRFSKVMDGSGNYKLYWSFNRRNENITFAVRVKTTGWVGFGLSPNGQMPNSDVIIGWVDSNGQVHMHDRHTVCRCTPIIDAQQDWYLINGEEEGGYTTLEFTRNFTTCDDNDLEIKAETQRIIWSYHSNDPGDFIPRHQYKGSKSLNLLGGLENVRTVPSDSKSFVVKNSNLSVPSRETTYWCSNHYLAEVTKLWEEEVYIYKARPVISPENLAYVHHMIVFLCPTYSLIERDGICSEITQNVFGCFGGEVLGAWAVGGEEFVFPEDVAFPLYVGLRENQPYKLLLEMHFDRTPPGGIVDSSGMEFFYTRQKPQHLAGTLSVSIGVIPVMIIPPNAEKFSYTTTCSSSCTDKYLPDDGITVFGSYLHSHLIGTGLTVKHFRNTSSSQCNAVEELKPIDQNLNYDFDFQQMNHLQEYVKVKRGDTISVQCRYNSKSRTNVTLGGESTRDEMCQALLLYYPKADIAHCGTFPDPNTVHRPFLNKYYFGVTQYVNLVISVLDAFYREGIAVAFNHIKWDDSVVTDLQEAINDATMEKEYCTSNRHVPPTQNSTTVQPKLSANCSYEATSKCTTTQPLSCCARLANNNGMSVKSIGKRSAADEPSAGFSGAESVAATVTTTLVMIAAVIMTNLM